MALDKLTSNAMKQTSLPEKAKISYRIADIAKRVGIQIQK